MSNDDEDELGRLEDLDERLREGFLANEVVEASDKSARIVHVLREISRAALNRSDSALADHKKHPDRIGRFEVLSLLGLGNFGAVYLAFDPVLNRQVAVKWLHSHLSSDVEVRNRIERERVLLAKLQHPNIVPVLDAGDEAGRPFLVNAYSNGIDLATWLKKHDARVPYESASSGIPLQPKTVFDLAIQLADAIQHSHIRGIVHRDIKPSNILLERLPNASDEPENESSSTSEIRWIPKITDFGLAKSLKEQSFLGRVHRRKQTRRPQRDCRLGMICQF